MKLLFCEIENFGKLHRERMEFTGNLCAFEKPNGWGKTTFSAFLKCMFYGMKDNRSKVLENNDRKKYMPWQGGLFGGAVGFLYRDKGYRVERSFGKTPAADTFAVYALETGLKTGVFGDGSDFGERVFGLDKESFCRTAYFPQDDGVFDELTGDIQGGLMRAFHTQGEKLSKENGLETALQRLDDAEKVLRKRRPAKGKLDEIDDKLTAITRAKGELFTAREDVAEARARVKAAGEDFAVLQNQIAECNREIGAVRASGAQNVWGEDPLYENYRREKGAAEERVNKLRAFFPQDPSSINFRLIEEKTSRYYALQTEKEKLSIESARPVEKPNKKPILGAVFLLLCVVLFAVAGYFLVSNNFAVAGVCGALGLCFAIACIVCFAGKKAVRQSPAPDVLQKTSEIDGELTALGRELSKDFSRFAIDRIFDYAAALETVKTKRDEYFNELQVLNRLRAMANEKAVETPKNTDNVEKLNALTVRRQALETDLAKLLDEKSAAIAALDDLERNVEELSLIVGEEKALQEEKERLEGKLAAIRTAKEYLQKANENLATRYLLPVSQGVKAYLRAFDGSLTVDITANGEPRVLDGGFTRETGYYSRGYQDVFGLCLRLAVLDALYTNEKPFLIFDDPFVNLDEKKTEAAKNLLKTLSNRYQIFYFTCKTPL